MAKVHWTPSRKRDAECRVCHGPAPWLASWQVGISVGSAHYCEEHKLALIKKAEAAAITKATGGSNG